MISGRSLDNATIPLVIELKGEKPFSVPLPSVIIPAKRPLTNAAPPESPKAAWASLGSWSPPWLKSVVKLYVLADEIMFSPHRTTGPPVWYTPAAVLDPNHWPAPIITVRSYSTG